MLMSWVPPSPPNPSDCDEVTCSGVWAMPTCSDVWTRLLTRPGVSTALGTASCVDSTPCISEPLLCGADERFWLLPYLLLVLLLLVPLLSSTHLRFDTPPGDELLSFARFRVGVLSDWVCDGEFDLVDSGVVAPQLDFIAAAVAVINCLTLGLPTLLAFTCCVS